MPKVLVTDCNSRKALCVVRSLGKQGFDVVAGCNEKVNVSRFSKYCSSFKYLPNPITEKEDYLDQVRKIILENDIDILIPMEDETVELFIKNIDILNCVKCLLPTHETFMIARDKGETIKSAIKSGVSCPNTYIVSNVDELEKLKNEITYPVIIKPRISSGSRGLVHIQNKEELIRSYKEVHEIYPLPIIQQYLTGNYVKVQVLLMLDNQHKVKASCTYQGIREFPVNGGPVTMWKTVSYPELEKTTMKFMEELEWVGFAEVEYIVDLETGKYFLMEINPRFSANIALAVNVGIDFPMILSKIVLNNEAVQLKKNTRMDEYCQWLLPGDILNFIFNKDRFKQDIGYFFNKPQKLCYAILSKDDPIPVFATILSMLINILGNLKNLKSKLKADK